MKAEHRKELETNVLADRIGRWLKDVKSGNRSRSFAIWGLVVLVVGIGLVWFVLKSSSNTAELWQKVDNATANGDINELNQLANNNAGTVPGRTARFQAARLLLHNGMQRLGSQSRVEAADRVEQARDVYTKLAEETSDAPLLMQEALMGAAKAEETLIGIPRKDDPKQSRGSLDRAVQLYNQVAAAKPETFHTRAAAERAKLLTDKGEEIEKFYTGLQDSFGKSRD
jgi:hypothetical protein